MPTSLRPWKLAVAAFIRSNQLVIPLYYCIYYDLEPAESIFLHSTRKIRSNFRYH